MFRTLDLGNQVWGGAAGALPPFDLRTMLSDVDGDAYGLQSVIFRIEFDITTGVGGGCTGREIHEWLSNLIFRGSVGVPIQGMNHYQLLILQSGCLGFYTGLHADIAAAQANDISVMYLIFPFERFRKLQPDQELPCVQAFKDATFLINTGVPLINADTTVNAMTVQGYGKVRRQGKVRFPSLPTYGSHADTIHCTLPDAEYDGLAMLAPTGGFAAVANINNVVVRAGDEDIHKSVGPDAVIASYLMDQVAGFGAAVAPFGLGGATDWAKGSADLLMLPLIWQNHMVGTNKATDQVDSQGSALSIECDGTLAAAQYIYCYYEANDVQNQRRQAMTFGAQMSSLDVMTPGLDGKPIPDNVIASKIGARVLTAQVRGVTGPEAGKIKFLTRK